MTTTSQKASKQRKMVILDTEVIDPRSARFMDFFTSRMIGQPNADKMAQMVFEQLNNRLRNKRRPIAVTVAIGPSRTGKSYSGHIMADFIHEDPEAVTELEGADYTERHQIQDLKGAPPSYVGSLTEKEKKELKPEDVDPRSKISTHNLRRVRLNSKSEINIVILNEFEKAHIDFYKFWMGVFDKGYATLSDGEKVDFTNTIFIITMNLGMEEVEKLEAGGIGFLSRAHKASQEEVDDIVKKALKQNYKREFRNRLDAVVVFKPHTQGDLYAIVGTELNLFRQRMSNQLQPGEMFEIELEDSAKQFLLDQAMADGGSVAELKRILDRELTNKVSRLLNNGMVGIGDKLVMFHAEGDSKLTAGLLEGEGDVAEVDKMAARGEAHSTGRNAAFQRQLHTARQQHAKGDGLEFYAISLWCESENQLITKTGELQHDLLKLYELKPVIYTVQLESPFMSVITVRTTPEMVELIQTKFPKATIVKKTRKEA